MKASIFLAFLVSVVLGHVCVLQPIQRGGADVSSPGSNDCVKPPAPCGGAAAGSPVQTLYTNQFNNVFIQQNLNHYTPGNPGVIDFAIANLPEPKTDDDPRWVVIKSIPDWWAHLQWNQKNLSIPIWIDGSKLSPGAAVLRVRYDPHKPTEPIFHNCADITIASGSATQQQPLQVGVSLKAEGTPDQNVLQCIAFVGPKSLPRLQATTIVALGDDGSLTPTAFQLPSGYAALEGMVAYNMAQSQFQIIYLACRTEDCTSSTSPKHIVLLSGDMFGDVSVTVSPAPKLGAGEQYVGLSGYGASSDATLSNFFVVSRIAPDNGPIVFQFRPLSVLQQQITVGAPVARFPVVSYYLNVQFVTSVFVQSTTSQKIFVLLQHENEPITMDSSLLAFDTIANTTVHSVLDLQKSPFESVYFTESSLFTVSPGALGSGQTQAKLGTIDYASLKYTVGQPLATPFSTAQYYGGGVYGQTLALVRSQTHIRHVFRDTAGALRFTLIDPVSNALLSSAAIYSGFEGDELQLHTPFCL